MSDPQTTNFGDYEILMIAKRLSRGPTAMEMEAHTRAIQIELDHVFSQGYAKGQKDERAN